MIRLSPIQTRPESLTVRYTLLIRYTEIGIPQIENTVARAAEFHRNAVAMGVSVDSLFWTLGEYDGIIMLLAAEETSVVALVAELAHRGYVRTHLLRAYTEDEFSAVLQRMPSALVDMDV